MTVSAFSGSRDKARQLISESLTAAKDENP